MAPCPCSGSVKWVHRICLLRWVLIDPVANGKICCICRLPYEEEVMPQLEQLPHPTDLSTRILSNPVVFTVPVRIVISSILYRIGYLSALISGVPTLLITAAYFAIFFAEFQELRYPRVYLRLLQISRFPAILAIHALALAILFFSFGADLGIGLSLDFYLAHYWIEHKNHVTRVNVHLLTVGPMR